MYSVKDSKKELKNIKARIFLNHNLDDQELGLEVMKNYLQSMDTFDPKYQITLNNLPLSRDIVQYSRKYNAPYWANSLKIFEGNVNHKVQNNLFP